MWSVCLTSKGVLNYLNRRISPVGERALPSQWQPCSLLRTLPNSTRVAARVCARVAKWVLLRDALAVSAFVD